MLFFVKKILSPVFLLIILLAFAGCNSSGSQSVQNTLHPTPTPVPSKLLYVETQSTIDAVRTVDGKVARTYPLPFTDDIANNGFPFTVANGAIYVAIGHQIIAINTSTGKLLWTTAISWNAESLVATQDGIFVALQGGLLYSFTTQTGGLKWRQTLSADLTSLQLLAANNLLYCWHDDVVVALDQTTGIQLWIDQTGSTAYYPVDSVYQTQKTLIAIREGFIRGLDPLTGKQKWSLDTTQNSNALHGVNVSESLLVNNTLYLGMRVSTDVFTGKNVLAAYDADTGKQIWSVDDNDVGNTVVTLTQEGFYAVGGPSMGVLTARSLQDGKQLWTKSGTGTYSSVKEDNGVVYAVDGKKNLDAFTAQDGKVLWTYASSTNLAFFDHEPYFMSEPLVALDAATGKARWQNDIGPVNNIYFFDSAAAPVA